MTLTAQVGSGDPLSVDLGAGKVRFGASVTCDYLLAGVDVPDLFSLNSEAAGAFAVEAHAPVTVDGVAMSPGEVRHGLRAASVVYQDTVVSIQSTRRSLRNRAAVAGLCALVVVAPLTYGLAHVSVASGGGEGPVGDRQVAARKAAVAIPSRPRSALESTREYLALLGYSVTVRDDGPGRLRVSGDVSSEQQALLMQALKSLRPNEEFVWEPRQSAPVAQAAPAPPKVVPPPKVSIASVTLLPTPTAITSEGGKLVTGAKLRGGWTVTRIALDAIDVRNGSETHRLVF